MPYRVDHSTDDYSQLREQMVEQQLARRGVCDERVLAAMRCVAREEFVDGDQRDSAYNDSALPLQLGQTISQPFTVALMCEALRLTGSEKVLDVGTGSGYAAAVLSCLARRVVSIERLPVLAAAAESRLARLGYDNVLVVLGDGSHGFAPEAPYEAIVAAAAAEKFPAALAAQLADQGRLVMPIGKQGQTQRLRCYTRHGDDLVEEDLGGFAFVPLVCD